MKKTKVLLLAMIFVVSFTFTGLAANEVKVIVDDQQIEFDVSPRVVNGRTMVPLRAIFEAIGATVTWDGDTGTVTAYKDNNVVKTTIGSVIMSVNGKTKVIDAAPILIDGRTLVPARFIAEAFGCTVDWDQNAYTVFIATDKYSKIPGVTYYDGTYIPDYSFVTGAKANRATERSYTDSGEILYTHYYERTTAVEDVAKYLKFLLELGWEESEKSNPDTLLIYTKKEKELFISDYWWSGSVVIGYSISE